MPSDMLLAKYEPWDQKTNVTGSHRQNGSLKKLILHIQYICTLKDIFEVVHSMVCCAFFLQLALCRYNTL